MIASWPVSMVKHAMKNTPHCIMLVGAPASGKSSWILNNNQNHVIISTDNILEEWASKRGMTYSQAWKEADLKKIEKQMKEEFHAALEAEQNIIIDRTNMSKKSRNKFLCHIPDNYWSYSIIFEVPREELNRRLLLRPGKHISDEVMDDILKRYEEPTNEEFDEVFK